MIIAISRFNRDPVYLLCIPIAYLNAVSPFPLALKLLQGMLENMHTWCSAL